MQLFSLAQLVPYPPILRMTVISTKKRRAVRSSITVPGGPDTAILAGLTMRREALIPQERATEEGMSNRTSTLELPGMHISRVWGLREPA